MSAEELLEFYKQELQDPDSHQHRVQAMDRLNQIATVLGPHSCRVLLVPLLDDLLNHRKLEPSLILNLTQSLQSSSPGRSLVSLVPWECLSVLICKHLLRLEEVDVRTAASDMLLDVALQAAFDKANLDVESIGEKLATILAASYPELTDSSLLPKANYLHLVAGITFLAKAQEAVRSAFGDKFLRVILSKDDLRTSLEGILRVGAHSSSSSTLVRIAIARNYTRLKPSLEVGIRLFLDSNDTIVIEACRACLPFVMTRMLERRGLEGFTSLVTRLVEHESYRVRIEFARKVLEWLNDKEVDEEAVSVVAKAMETRLRCDPDLVAKRVFLESMTKSPRLLKKAKLSVVEETLQSMEQRFASDAETRLSITRARIGLIVDESSAPSLLVRLEHEMDAQVHLLTTTALLEDSVVRRLGGRAFIRRVYRSLSVDRSQLIPSSFMVKVTDVTCWRSLVLALRRSREIILSVFEGDAMAWMGDDGGGGDFIEFCLGHACARVGQVCVEDLIKPLIVDDGSTLVARRDWIDMHLAPMTHRLLLRVDDTNVKANLLSVCPILVTSSLEAQEIVIAVIERSLRDRSRAIRERSAMVAATFIQRSPITTMGDNESKVIEMVKTSLDKESDLNIRKTLEKVFKMGGGGA